MTKTKIHYLYHDGFIIETQNHILIFDHFNHNSSNGGSDLSDGVISEEVFNTEKNIYVFVSHGHGDHYNPLIFNWKSTNPKIEYILSSDIQAKDIDNEYMVISEGESIQLDTIFIKAYGSTDIGVSFLVKVDGIRLFHAGDLNLWHWKDESDEDNAQMAKAFKAEIHKIQGEEIDIAFFPVDPRLEEYYYLGGKYFIEKLNPKLFIPMHFGDNNEVTKDFAEALMDSSTKIVVINERGQEILF
jgi:L-ascorbate metabolism protein UlaG (beta-lactamase superfamily)